MKSCVVDTDVVSFLFKGHPIGRAYEADLADSFPFISFMAVAELERWALESNWGDQRLERLRRRMKRFSVIPSSEDLCRKWAEVMAQAQASGRRIECADAWMAASALLYDVPLVTNNRKDYLGVKELKIASHS